MDNTIKNHILDFVDNPETQALRRRLLLLDQSVKHLQKDYSVALRVLDIMQKTNPGGDREAKQKQIVARARRRIESVEARKQTVIIDYVQRQRANQLEHDHELEKKDDDSVDGPKMISEQLEHDHELEKKDDDYVDGPKLISEELKNDHELEKDEDYVEAPKMTSEEVQADSDDVEA